MLSRNTSVATCIFLFNDSATTEIYTLSLHDALPIYAGPRQAALTARPLAARCPTPARQRRAPVGTCLFRHTTLQPRARSEEHTSELQSRQYFVCRLLLEKKTISSVVISPSTEITSVI